jgi:hypothetical protein
VAFLVQDDVPRRFVLGKRFEVAREICAQKSTLEEQSEAVSRDPLLDDKPSPGKLLNKARQFPVFLEKNVEGQIQQTRQFQGKRVLLPVQTPARVAEEV